MKLYIDIDGVLIAKGQKPANHVTEFLKVATGKHDCFWLTTHSKANSKIQTVTEHMKGDDPAITSVMDHVKDVLPFEAITYCEHINPTVWSYQKTEAIDFSSDFLWFDDTLFDFEKEVLEQHNKLSSFVLVDLINNPDQLKELIKLL